jgi:hypothetical protein
MISLLTRWPWRGGQGQGQGQGHSKRGLSSKRGGQGLPRSSKRGGQGLPRSRSWSTEFRIYTRLHAAKNRSLLSLRKATHAAATRAWAHSSRSRAAHRLDPENHLALRDRSGLPAHRGPRQARFLLQGQRRRSPRTQAACAAAQAQGNPETKRLWKKFQQLLSLPEKDQHAFIRLINSLVGTKSDDADAA